MGILDEAIREHLERKRQHGAEGDELQRLEDEAFGPPTRPGEPDFPEAGIPEDGGGEEKTTVLADNGQAQTSEEPAVAPPAPPEAGDAPPAEAPPADAPSADADPAEAPSAEQSADEHAVVSEPPEESPAFYDQSLEDGLDLGDVDLSLDDPQPVEATETPAATEPPPPAEAATADPPAPEPPPPAPEPPAAEPPAPEPPTSAPETSPEPPTAPPATPPIESLETVEHPLEPASEELPLEPASDEYDVAEPDSEEYEAEPPSDEHAVAEPETGEGEHTGPETGEEERTEPESSEEDVLADTPEFLRDAPEDDELWFEQGEPKDFDFD